MNYYEYKAGQYFNKLNNIQFLNHGGCLVAAYAVYLAIKKLAISRNDKVPDMALVHLETPYYKNTRHLKQNRRFMQGRAQTATSATHFCLRINDIYMDSDSNNVLDEFVVGLEVSEAIDTFAYSALKHGNWNRSFDMENEVPFINKLLNVNIKI